MDGLTDDCFDVVALPEVDPDLVVLQRIERGMSTTQDVQYVSERLSELRRMKQEAGNE